MTEAKKSYDFKVEIRPIPDRHGIREFSENLEYFSGVNVIGPFVNPVTRKFETGLSKSDKEYLENENFPYNIADDYTAGTPHEFWESSIAKTELANSPTFLYPGRSLIDFVKYKYLLVNNYIYKSEAEMLTGSKPLATHYIYNEAEELEVRATKIEKMNKIRERISNLSLKKKREIILILENEVTDNKKEDYLTVRFEDILLNPDKTQELESLLKRADEDIMIEAEIKNGIQKNVLRRTRQGIFYFETNLGFSEHDVKEFLLKPENQEVYLSIKSKIE